MPVSLEEDWLDWLDWLEVEELGLCELLGSEDDGVLCATIQAVQPNKVIVSKIFLVMATLLVFFGFSVTSGVQIKSLARWHLPPIFGWKLSGKAWMARQAQGLSLTPELASGHFRGSAGNGPRTTLQYLPESVPEPIRKRVDVSDSGQKKAGCNNAAGWMRRATTGAEAIINGADALRPPPQFLVDYLIQDSGGTGVIAAVACVGRCNVVRPHRQGGRRERCLVRGGVDCSGTDHRRCVFEFDGARGGATKRAGNRRRKRHGLAVG